MKGYGLIHAIATCKDCDWEDQDWQVAQKTAREHHKKTGHEVNLEIGYNKIYQRSSQNNPPEIKPSNSVTKAKTQKSTPD